VLVWLSRKGRDRDPQTRGDSGGRPVELSQYEAACGPRWGNAAAQDDLDLVPAALANYRHSPRLVPGQQLGGPAPTMLVFEIEIAEPAAGSGAGRPSGGGLPTHLLHQLPVPHMPPLRRHRLGHPFWRITPTLDN
jgi:hypothetical protein